MATIDYLDFDLRIERSEHGYRARVLNAPSGQSAAEFGLPFSDEGIENFVLRVGQTRRAVRGRRDSPQLRAAKTFGGRLFDAVFGGDVGVHYRQSLDRAAEGGKGLRLRLSLADAPELADVPWECLYNADLNRFLALSDRTPLVRYLELPERIRPLTVESPVRVLAMVSSPRDYPPLDADRECGQLGEALRDLEPRGLVSLDRLEQATWRALQRRLQQGSYHIFHFVGHGSFDREAEDGVLILEDEEEQGRPVSGQHLGTLLHDHASLRLAILNACEGGRAARDDPFAGVAQSLVQQGIPAVIAMQFEITDEAAITFARDFYGAVSAGYPVDAALAEARKAIFGQGGGNTIEWGTPVLYMRAPNGRIFDVATQAPTSAAADGRPPLGRQPDEEEQQARLGELYTRALSAYFQERWDRAIDILGEIVSQQADYEDAAAMLEEATRQRSLAHHYSEGMKAAEARAWAEAIEQLQAVVAVDAAYRDAQDRLEEAERQQTLADLYGRARRLHQAQEWQAVINVFERIAALDSAYPDPDGLPASARQELEAQQQEEHKAALYGRALRAMKAGEWPQAEAHFEEIRRLDPGYRDTEVLLARARQALTAHKAAEEARAEEERRRARAADLEREAAEALDREDWPTAIARLQALLNLDPARSEASADLIRARQQQEMATLYASGRKHYAARRWREALDDFQRLRDIGGDYKDVDALIAETERGLARKEAVPPPRAPSGEMPTGPRHLPTLGSRKRLAGIGLAAILVVSLGAMLLSQILPTGHADAVTSAAFSPDGRYVVSTGYDRTARIWAVDTGKMLTVLPDLPVAQSGAVSPDGRYVVTASSNGAEVWEAGSGKRVHTMRGGADSAAFSADGRYVATANWDRKARVWDATTGILVRELSGHTDAVNGAGFSPDGRYVVTASRDYTARIWEADTGTPVREIKGHSSESAAFSRDGKFLLTSSASAAQVWESATGNLVREVRGHTSYVSSAAFSPDGTRVVTAGGDRTVRIWEVSTGRELVRLGGSPFPWGQ